MKYIFDIGKIDGELQSKGLTRNDLTKALGKSYGAVKLMLVKGSIETETLEKIAAYLELSILNFISIDGQPLVKYIEQLKERSAFYQQRGSEIIDLRKQLNDKERVIRLYEKTHKMEQDHKEEIDNITGELQKAQRANYR